MTDVNRQPWPLRPRPYSDEGLAGYLLRIAHIYGWPSVPGLCTDLIGRRPVEANLRGGRFEHATSRMLALVMQIPETNLHAQWQRLGRKHGCYDNNRIINDVQIGPPRACAECLSINGYFRFEWQVGHVLVCTEHQRWLRTTCPHCDTLFTWRSALLDGCPDCHLSWSRLSRDDTLCQQPHWQGLNRATDLRTLYRAFLASALPGAAQLWSHQCLPYEPRTHAALMGNAYRTVYSDECNASLITAAKQRWYQLGSLKARGVRHLSEEIHALRLRAKKNLQLGPLAPIEQISGEHALPKRVHNVGLSGAAVALAASVDVCAKLLGISSGTLHGLVDAAVLPEAGTARIRRDRLFDLRAVSAKIDTWPNSNISDVGQDIISLETAAGIMSLFGFEAWHVLAWCANGQLAFAWTAAEDTSLGARLRTSKSGLITRAECEFGRTGSDAYTLGQVLKLLCITEREAIAFCHAGYLRDKKRRLPYQFFEREPIMEFMRVYRLARREARLSEVSVQSAWQRILAAGCVCVLERLEGGRLIGLARREGSVTGKGLAPLARRFQSRTAGGQNGPSIETGLSKQMSHVHPDGFG